MIFILDFEDSQGDNIANLDNFLGMIDTAVAQLGNVDQTFEVTGEVQAGKGAETG